VPVEVASSLLENLTMWFGRLGGALVVSGCTLTLVTGVIFLFGGSVSIGGLTPGGLVMGAGMLLVGSGLGMLGLAGPRPLNSVAVRFGLVTLGLGLLVYLSSTVIAAGMDYDPLESWPFIITFLVGGAATLLGTVTTVISLLLVRGPSRLAGGLFPIGIALLVAASTVAHATIGGTLFEVIGTLIAVVGGITLLASIIGVGLLPWYAARSPRVVAAA
jgi:hypothetical protein